MFTFPTTSDLIGRWGMFLYTGPLTICVAILILWFWRRQKRKSRSSLPLPDETPPRIWLIVGSMGMLVGVVHLLVVWWSFWNEMALQFDPHAVVEIEVQRFQYNEVGWQELDPLSPVITISKPKHIQEGLQKLDSSEPFYSNHESPVGGYSFRLQFRPEMGRSDVYLAIHQDTTRTRDAHIVIPMEGPTNGDGFVGGEYQCDAFLEWFESDIVPMIEE